MNKLIVAVMLCVGLSSVGMALFGSHGQKFDWQALELTQSQQQQIDQIQQAYQAEFQRIRKYQGSKIARNEQMFSLKNEMIANIQNLLSDEQKQQAHQMMAEKLERREAKRLQLQGHKLSLTRHQQEQQVISS